MKELYDIMAHNHDGNEVDPTRGQLICASSAEEAMNEAQRLAEEQGLDLKDFYICDVETVFEGEPFKYYDKTDGIVVYTEDGEDVFFILDYGNEEDNKEHKKILEECNDLDDILSEFDENRIIPLYLPENLRKNSRGWWN